MGFDSSSGSSGNPIVMRSLIQVACGLCVAALLGVGPTPVAAVDAVEPSPFVRPPELEADVRFWIRVYTEVTTDQGLLHDSWNLGLVYEVVRFDPELSPAARERRINEAKARYAALLRRFAANSGGTLYLTTHERRILHAFGERATASDFIAAIDRIRFQLGQADRFHAGLIRAEGIHEHIENTLRQSGVPEEIAALPHVESSFDPAAYSRVGAAGLWQFMPSTARRYMRVDGLVDERLDPYRSTEAAANLMLYNYRLVGTWPLAVTAYNHGPGGLRRAQDELGTSDIAVIVKRFQGATFGFASRNFYVAFLAALEVDRNADKYFGALSHLPDAQSVTVQLPDYLPIGSVAKAFHVDMGALTVLNPALRPPIWNGTRFVPRGYALRVPGTPTGTEVAVALARIPAGERYLSQRGDATHRLRRGETLAAIAAQSGVPLARLLAANGWTSTPALQRGQILRVPLPPTRAETVRGDTPSLAREPAEPPPAAPVVAAATPATSLAPAATPTSNSDTTDYGVAQNDTVTVQAAETLGHFADWSGMSVDELRRLNRLHKGTAVGLGRKIKLKFTGVNADQFTSARRLYHRGLQETYFANHRIAATQSYAIKRGDSLWTVAHQHGDLPVWLITEYNPDIDFGDMRPGTSIILPDVEPINRQ
jgi:membrane-bound lytic murein transglycosylase D